MRSTRTRLSLLLTATLMVVTGCSGPRRSIEVTVKELPGDVAIGKKTTVPPAAPPSGVNPEPAGFPSFIQPPPPVRYDTVGRPIDTVTTTSLPKPAPPCRAANPLDAPKLAAPRNVSAPPVEQLVEYGNAGTYEVSTRAGTGQKGAYPVTTYRRVSSKPVGDGSYDVLVLELDTYTIYHLVPDKGIYIREVATRRPDGSVDSFRTDQDSILLLPLPVAEGAQVGGVGVDALGATTMSVVGTVVGKARVDVCGTPVDTWEVQVTEGRVTSPDKQIHFTATYDIGTQYGGLSVRDTVAVGCDANVNEYCDYGRKVDTQNTATMVREPPVVQR
jgi:hypothetical protein